MGRFLYSEIDLSWRVWIAGRVIYAHWPVSTIATRSPSIPRRHKMVELRD